MPSVPNQMTGLDSGQVIREVYDPQADALQIREVAGKLISEQFDNIALTYVPSGNGSGQIQSVIYKMGGATVATLTLTYDSSDRIATIVKS